MEGRIKKGSTCTCVYCPSSYYEVVEGKELGSIELLFDSTMYHYGNPNGLFIQYHHVIEWPESYHIQINMVQLSSLFLYIFNRGVYSSPKLLLDWKFTVRTWESNSFNTGGRISSWIGDHHWWYLKESKLYSVIYWIQQVPIWLVKL